MSVERTYASEKCENNYTGADERSAQCCVLALMAAKKLILKLKCKKRSKHIVLLCAGYLPRLQPFLTRGLYYEHTRFLREVSLNLSSLTCGSSELCTQSACISSEKTLPCFIFVLKLIVFFLALPFSARESIRSVDSHDSVELYSHWTQASPSQSNKS